jgi:4-hydroxybenzoate polyprenyltransferase
MMAALIKLIRPHQYIKNGFVLIGVIFAGQWNQPTLISAALTFLAFCAIASAVYVINDILDVEADRQHPTKRNRPLASGKLSMASAKITAAVLLIVAMVLAATVSGIALAIVLTYFVMNLVYSWRLKHVVIMDVFIISAGFMLRILAGTLGIGIAPSEWLLLCGFMVTLFLGFAKRRAELLTAEAIGGDAMLMRRVLDDYNPKMLDIFLGVTAACSILGYGLYAMSAETMQLHGTHALVYTLPFVVYGIFRYLYLLYDKGHGTDTANDLLDDRHMLLTVVCWLMATLGILAWTR